MMLATVIASASESTPIDYILTLSKPPPGVVFEVVTGKQDALGGLLPTVSTYTERLREKYPGLDIAVVTHGMEQFALLTEHQEKHSSIHDAVQLLTGDADIPVHVCGNHASFRDKAPEDFPKYVDVAVSAPAKVNEYRKLGYRVVVLVE